MLNLFNFDRTWRFSYEWSILNLFLNVRLADSFEICRGSGRYSELSSYRIVISNACNNGSVGRFSRSRVSQLCRSDLMSVRSTCCHIAHVMRLREALHSRSQTRVGWQELAWAFIVVFLRDRLITRWRASMSHLVVLCLFFKITIYMNRRRSFRSWTCCSTCHCFWNLLWHGHRTCLHTAMSFRLFIICSASGLAVILISHYLFLIVHIVTQWFFLSDWTSCSNWHHWIRVTRSFECIFLKFDVTWHVHLGRLVWFFWSLQLGSLWNRSRLIYMHHDIARLIKCTPLQLLFFLDLLQTAHLLATDIPSICWLHLAEDCGRAKASLCTLLVFPDAWRWPVFIYDLIDLLVSVSRLSTIIATSILYHLTRTLRRLASREVHILALVELNDGAFSIQKLSIALGSQRWVHHLRGVAASARWTLAEFSITLPLVSTRIGWLLRRAACATHEPIEPGWATLFLLLSFDGLHPAILSFNWLASDSWLVLGILEVYRVVVICGGVIVLHRDVFLLELLVVAGIRLPMLVVEVLVGYHLRWCAYTLTDIMLKTCLIQSDTRCLMSCVWAIHHSCSL